MKLKINRKVCKLALILAGLLLLGVLLFTILSHWEKQYGALDASDSGTSNGSRVYLDGRCYVPNENMETVLFIGIDKYEAQTETASYNNNQQADFLMLLLLDRESKTCTALHLNRDTIADIPVLGVRGESAGTISGQLALAHTYGSGRQDSCRNTVDAVSNLLYGVKIDHYIALTMDAIAKVNDLVGGVTVTVLDDLTSISPAMSKGAVLNLTGDMALSYVRARYGLEDSSNLRRMERQRQYLTELRGALSAKIESSDTFLLKLLDSVSPYMLSDCTANQLSQLYDRWDAYADEGFAVIEGEAKEGAEFMEFHPDESKLKQLVIDLFYIPLDE